MISILIYYIKPSLEPEDETQIDGCSCHTLFFFHSPVTGAGHQHTQEIVDDEGEDDSSDGAAGDGVARILQLTCGGTTQLSQSAPTQMRAHNSTSFNRLTEMKPFFLSDNGTHTHTHTPDMLEPAMIPVQPLNMTANTVANVIVVCVV